MMELSSLCEVDISIEFLSYIHTWQDIIPPWDILIHAFGLSLQNMTRRRKSSSAKARLLHLNSSRSLQWASSESLLGYRLQFSSYSQEWSISQLHDAVLVDDSTNMSKIFNTFSILWKIFEANKSINPEVVAHAASIQTYASLGVTASLVHIQVYGDE